MHGRTRVIAILKIGLTKDLYTWADMTSPALDPP